MPDAAPESVTVLHVDDDPAFTDLVARYLEAEGLTVLTEQRAADGLDRLDDESVDCVVSDYEMPGMDGLEFLDAVRERHPDLPFVLFTGEGDEGVASDAISAGVTEYLQKGRGTDRYAVLANRVRTVVEKHRAERDRERRLRQQEAAAELGTAAVQGTAIEDLFDRATDRVAAVLSVPYVALFEHRPDRDDLVLRAGTGVDGSESTTIDAGANSRAGYTLQCGEPVIVTDRETEDRFDDVALTDAYDHTAGMSVVVPGRERPWGVLGVETDESRTFDEHDATFLQTVANVLGGAVARADELDRRREAERRIRSEKDTLERVLETVPAGITVADRDGDIVFANDRAETIHGLDRGSITDRRYDDPEWVITDLDGSEFDESRLPFRQVLDTGAAVYDVRHAIDHPDGTRRYLSVNGAPWLDDAGDIRRVVFSLRDVTAQVERERELQEYRTLVETIGDPMYVADPDGVIQMANEAMTEALNAPKSEIVGSHVSRFMPDEDVETGTAVIEDLLGDDDREWATFELRAGSDADEWTRFENKIGVVRDADGTYVGTAGVIRDITERKRRQEALARQNEQLEEFTSVISHDLRNPLSVLAGRVELARETGDEVHLDAMERAIERMDTLLEELLVLAREGKVVSDPRPVSLPYLCREAWEGVASGNATLSIDARMGTVEADPTRCRELLENLFRNSVEHGSTGARSQAPEASLEHGGTGPDAQAADTDGVAIRVESLPGDAGFAVSDDGPGVPPGRREAVFEYGHTTEDDGTGLGLAIVKRIAEAHGWRVELTDSAAGGARFEFWVEE